MIKFEELDHASIYIKDISIRDVATGLDGYTRGFVSIAGERTDLEVSAHSTDEDLVMVAYEIIKNKAYDSMEKVKDVFVDTSCDAVLENPEPLNVSESIDKVCRSKGFVVGAIAYRVITMDDLDYPSLGVCTGWHINEKIIYVDFSDGLVCPLYDCTVITDIDKSIMRFVSEEHQRNIDRVNMLQQQTNDFLNKLIYE
jgi:hypothetical protein